MEKLGEDHWHKWEFPVPGAGKLRIGNGLNGKCGDAIGLAFAMGLMENPAGGVMDRVEVVLLRDKLTELLDQK